MTKIWALAADVFYHIHIFVFYMLSSLFWLMEYWDLQPKQTMQVKALLEKKTRKDKQQNCTTKNIIQGENLERTK